MGHGPIGRLILTIGAVGLVAACSSPATSGRGSADTGAPATVATSGAVKDLPHSRSAATPTPPASTGESGATASAAPAAPTPAGTPTTSAVTTPAGFVGSWSGHGRLLTVSHDGSVTIDFRTYVNCTATVTTGCDRITGNAIHDGGKVVGRITRVVNPTTVTVTVTSTSVPKIVPTGPFRLGHDLGHDAVAPFVGGLSGTPFCGPKAPAGYCGA